MKVNLYSVRDLKAGMYSPVFQARSDAEALRQFAALAENPQSMLSKYPGEFVLCLVGTFCDSTGQLYQMELPTVVNNETAA